MFKVISGGVAATLLCAAPGLAASLAQATASYTVTLPDLSAYDGLTIYAPSYNYSQDQDQETTGSAGVDIALDWGDGFALTASVEADADDGTAEGWLLFDSLIYISNASETESATFSVTIDSVAASAISTDGAAGDAANGTAILGYLFGDVTDPASSQTYSDGAILGSINGWESESVPHSATLSYTLEPGDTVDLYLHGYLFAGADGYPLVPTPPAAAVPLPAGGLLLLGGLAGFGLYRRR